MHPSPTLMKPKTALQFPFLSFPFPALLHIFMYHTALCCCPNHWQEPPLGLHTTTIILNKKKNMTCFCLNIVIEILFSILLLLCVLSKCSSNISIFLYCCLDFREILNLMKILFQRGGGWMLGKKKSKINNNPRNFVNTSIFSPFRGISMNAWLSQEAHWLAVSYSCFPPSLNLFFLIAKFSTP